MSGGGGGMGGQGSGSRAYGVSVNRSALSKGIKAAPARSSQTGGLGGRGGTGQGRALEANAIEAVAKAVPESKGPSGVDTGGAGTDPISRLMQSSTAARKARQRMARGGGLSNITLGGATLG